MPEQIIFHIDVNSAFLSWEAYHRLHDLGETIDIRNYPSAIGGNEQTRHGIVLAKSPSAKACGIKTGEPLVRARQKCPDLMVFPPNHSLYARNSSKFINLLKEFSPEVEQYSIDEAFCNMTGTEKLYGDMIEFANRLKDIIHERLGFTVNIGISSNKLLAKMASDFEKPDKVHTLFPDEISTKLWPLPIEELFFVGRVSAKKLRFLGLNTIGAAAKCDKSILEYHFKKQGETIWNYANGIDDSNVIMSPANNKGYGNSITTHFDVTDASTAKMILLSLCENVGARLRADKVYISVVSVSIVDSEFNHYSKQCSLSSSTNVTEEIYDTICRLFDECWKTTPIRLLGVSTSKATTDKYAQYNLFDKDKYDKLSKLDSAIDNIRGRYGEDAIKRARFVGSEHNHMTGKK